jgi:cobalamin biosynthesis Mg chelatase CobN
MKYIYTFGLCLVFALFTNINLTNAQLTPAPSKTQCPATCPQGQQCIKKADGFLECRATATDCKKTNGSAGCDTGKVCVKATATATTGICVDDAPASAKAQTNPTSGGGGSGSTQTGGAGQSGGGSTTSAGGGGLQQGLTEFQGAGSGLNTQGTLIGYIANIIRWILGILGTVFFIIIVIQGYLYMTAGGDSGKTASAVGAIGNAVVGLLIIMGAFLITNFVTS